MKIWVVGRGGLLGRSVEQVVDRIATVYKPDKSIDWHDRDRASAQLANCSAEFFADRRGENWAIFWCAGRGTLNSPSLQMQDETFVFENFLKAVQRAAGEHGAFDSSVSGTLFFASSAGAVYAGSKNPPFTELTPTISVTPYGDAKLRQESLLREFSVRTNTSVLIGRISNLYGARQDLGKNQGLIATICYSVLRRQPINLFVPLETSRNYIYVEDAARKIVRHTMSLSQHQAGSRFVVKLFVAPENVTVGGILNVARSVLRVKPLVTFSTPPNSPYQAQNLVFKSIVDTGLDDSANTGFSDGMKRVMLDLQRAFVDVGWQKKIEHSG